MHRVGVELYQLGGEMGATGATRAAQGQTASSGIRLRMSTWSSWHLEKHSFCWGDVTVSEQFVMVCILCAYFNSPLRLS